jgi:beta-phosphoglucomutase family hydrolase
VHLGRLGLTALVFDLDGVVTRTASVHARAWKHLFDAFLKARAAETGEPFVPFDIEADYVAHVDGLPRYDGVRTFLASRGIDLPFGSADDPPGAATVRGLGNRKNTEFNAVLAEHGVEVYPASLALIRHFRAAGLRTAIASSSKNAVRVLETAGIQTLFDAVVDGNVSAREGLPGKPDPAIFVRAAELVGATPAEAAVFEDAVAGIEAGRAGAFRLVVGVDRRAGAEALLDGGADVVVNDLGDLPLD